MSISSITRHLQGFSNREAFVLRNGQIVQGKIVKLFPQNKAEIQIGTQKLIAEIVTPLRVGEKYFFQVQGEKDQLIHLKVLDNHHSRGAQPAASSLLSLLGISATRQTNHFLQQLLDEKIPFEPAQLAKAITLIDQKGYKPEVVATVKEMIVHRLPMTESVFQALFSMKTASPATLMGQLLNDLHQAPTMTKTESQLASLLNHILIRPDTTVAPQAPLPIRDEIFINLLKISGVYDEYISETKISAGEKVTQPSALNENFTFPLANRFINSSVALAKESVNLQKTSAEIMKNFRALETNMLKEEQIQKIRSVLEEKLYPFLPKSSQLKFQSLINEPTLINQKQLFELLSTLTKSEAYKIGEEVMRGERSNITFSKMPAQIQFLSLIHQYIQTIGLKDEFMLQQFFFPAGEQTQENSLHTIKSYLIQMMQESAGLSNEKIQPLLHLINGMQLQSVQESNHFILTSLQLPGEKLNLHKDLYMEFEGRKTKDGKLDPEFCRILFILHLKQLKETIIDMHIQKKVITLTVYNDFPELTHSNMESVQGMLQKNLEKIDYQLSAVNWKPLQDKTVSVSRSKNGQEMQNERFDFRI